MATDTDKTPLHSIVSVICDTVHDLSPADQARALEAVRVALGIAAPVAPVVPAVRPRADLQPLVPLPPPLPLVQVEMVGNAAMVVGGAVNRPGRAMLVVDPLRRNPRLRQLPRLPEPTDAEVPRGYVRSLRSGR